jgi:hypothetical protein
MLILTQDMNPKLNLEENILLAGLTPTTHTEIHNGIKITGMEIALLDFIYGARVFSPNRAVIAERALLKLNSKLKGKI